MHTRDAAFYLSLAEKTLRNLRSRGGGPPFIRLLSGRIAYRVSDLDAWVSSRQFQSTSEY
ncbi:helix-turn-helix domain-containing protein [Xanthobacter autotrophicus]|uniref:helix-turn-helix transcriptional regulator n=1 Tax=Xanthobacter autotrophicus TaxID=280 RepID=UPI003AB9365B|nr:helix-turn-helix domain-containing protein [Xanthobacter autotrophicus]